MLGLESRHRGSWLGSTEDEGWRPARLARRPEPAGPSTTLLVMGAVVVGLGLLAWYYVGPDLRRYLKIHSM
jgi:hypothetical protein